MENTNTNGLENVFEVNGNSKEKKVKYIIKNNLFDINKDHIRAELDEFGYTEKNVNLKFAENTKAEENAKEKAKKSRIEELNENFEVKLEEKIVKSYKKNTKSDEEIDSDLFKIFPVNDVLAKHNRFDMSSFFINKKEFENILNVVNEKMESVYKNKYKMTSYSIMDGYICMLRMEVKKEIRKDNEKLILLNWKLFENITQEDTEKLIGSVSTAKFAYNQIHSIDRKGESELIQKYQEFICVNNSIRELRNTKVMFEILNKQFDEMIANGDEHYANLFKMTFAREVANVVSDKLDFLIKEGMNYLNKVVSSNESLLMERMLRVKENFDRIQILSAYVTHPLVAEHVAGSNQINEIEEKIADLRRYSNTIGYKYGYEYDQVFNLNYLFRNEDKYLVREAFNKFQTSFKEYAKNKSLNVEDQHIRFNEVVAMCNYKNVKKIDEIRAKMEFPDYSYKKSNTIR